ncbi:MAG TPA: hypothetical protein VMV71_02670 [Candidatus Paceibacterota bacterium]|nr:hypothetical protein [Candidatus Paceibacterota bacterium]
MKELEGNFFLLEIKKGGNMKLEIPVWTKPAVWGVVVGALAWWMVLSSFGWVSAGTAAQVATQKAQDAVVAYATPVCVARFERQPNVIAAWEVLSKTDDWKQGDHIKDGGWVSEPGQKINSDMADAIATGCATQVLALKTIGGVKLSAAK